MLTTVGPDGVEAIFEERERGMVRVRPGVLRPVEIRSFDRQARSMHATVGDVGDWALHRLILALNHCSQ